MSRLKVLLRGALISEINLIPEKEYIAGRKDGSDIRLQAEKGISREHFRVKFAEGRWVVQAISRFGELFSLGQKAEEVILEHGQSFQVPPYEFQFLEVPDSDVPQQNSDGRPQVLDENTRTVLGAAPQVPYIKMVNSNDQVTEMLRLEVGDLWVAGRDPSCQIVIPDQRVSRRQFEIHKVNAVYTILDLASVNGTFLNGSSISSTDPQVLKSGDVITVLDNTMYFELHDPNFKFKVEKIDIPSLPIEEIEDAPESLFDIPDEPGVNQYPMEVPQISMGEAPPSLGIDPNVGGPFTGIPPEADPNQFYTFTPDNPPPVSGWKKFTSNKPLVAIVALLFLGGAFFLSEQMNSETGQEAAPVAAQEGDAFLKLTPKQQSEVKELYSLADQMMTQQKYDLALEKIRKIHELLPAGYKESKSIQLQAEQSILTILQQQEDEKRQAEEREQKKMFEEVVAKCSKLLGPNVDIDKLKECFVPVSSVDPSHPDYVRIIGEAENILTDRRLKEAEKKNTAEQIAELRKLFALAEKVQNEGYAFKAIKSYQRVVDSTLPDPGKLKAKSKTRIEFIRSKIDEKTQKNITEAETLFKDGKLKESVIALRESLVYDPENKQVKEKIDQYTNELRRQMMVLYQEAIIDESYGVVENTETREGAKDKWKKIVTTDLEDGEYYKKAVIKLRKYGVL